MERERATKFIHELLDLLVKQKGSDLFITADFPPAIKVDGKITPVSKSSLRSGLPQPCVAAAVVPAVAVPCDVVPFGDGSRSSGPVGVTGPRSRICRNIGCQSRTSAAYGCVASCWPLAERVFV